MHQILILFSIVNLSFAAGNMVGMAAGFRCPSNWGFAAMYFGWTALWSIIFYGAGQ